MIGTHGSLEKLNVDETIHFRRSDIMKGDVYMSNSLFNVINSRYSDFSKGQKLIAKYISENYDKAAFMTASKLGKTVGVSESTVVRFATELGYDGYPALQKAIQEMIRNRLTSVQRIDVACNRISDDNLLGNVLASDIEKLRRTIDEASNENFNKAVEMICSAKKIYILGARSAEALAVFLGYYLKLIFKNVVVIDPSNESDTLAQMMHVDSDACVIGISFPRYCNSAIAALKFANTKSANIIAITDSLSSPLTQYAECSLIAKSDMLSIVDSLVAPMSMINALIVAAIKRNQDEVSQTFRQLDEIWDEYDIYQKPEEGVH